ncbi:MAG: 50S ribosomal protein L20 [Nitrospirae bacterium]|nr:50S ribosomal protein L20 [Nitrospirota bacterium]
MPRARGGYKTRRRRKKILARAKGFWGRRNRIYKAAKETVHRAWRYEYRSRRLKKRDFRALWIQRINAGAREQHLTYSQLVSGLRKKGIAVNRKMLSELAVNDPVGFTKLAESARQALQLPNPAPAGQA